MNRITVNPERGLGTINRNLYGHFSEHLGRCIYGGIFVGEDSPIPNVNGMRTDVVEALKAIRIPVLRWPGGCFADEYHWQDGIGPKEGRKRMVNTNWGHVVEDNSFGTHEFLELCRQLGCEPYINANVGSGTVREMAEWVEYLNSPGDSTVVRQRWANGRKDPWGVKYWGVGNESWGCGGNMRPEYYADEYRRYQTYCRDYPGSKLFRIACGPNTDDYRWTEVLMERAGRFMDGLSLHYYSLTGPTWEEKGHALTFTEERVLRADAPRRLHGRAGREPRQDHGPLRPRKAGGPDRGRVGQLAPGGGRHQPRLPLPAEHHARRHGGRHDAEHLQPPLRPRGHGEPGPDRERAAVGGAHRGRQDGPHPHLARVRPVQGPPGRPGRGLLRGDGQGSARASGTWTASAPPPPRRTASSR